MAESETIPKIQTSFVESSLGKIPRIQIVNQTRLKNFERHLLTFPLNKSSCLDQQKLNKCCDDQSSRKFHELYLAALYFVLTYLGLVSFTALTEHSQGILSNFDRRQYYR